MKRSVCPIHSRVNVWLYRYPSRRFHELFLSLTMISIISLSIRSFVHRSTTDRGQVHLRSVAYRCFIQEKVATLVRLFDVPHGHHRGDFHSCGNARVGNQCCRIETQKDRVLSSYVKDEFISLLNRMQCDLDEPMKKERSVGFSIVA